MDFMKCTWEHNETVHVTLIVKEYPVGGVSFEDIKPTIHEIREKSSHLKIKADVAGITLEKFKSIVKLLGEVVEYTRNDAILEEIQIVGAGFLLRTLYRPISLAVPKYFRDMIVFL